MAFLRGSSHQNLAVLACHWLYFSCKPKPVPSPSPRPWAATWFRWFHNSTHTQRRPRQAAGGKRRRQSEWRRAPRASGAPHPSAGPPPRRAPGGVAAIMYCVHGGRACVAHSPRSRSFICRCIVRLRCFSGAAAPLAAVLCFCWRRAGGAVDCAGCLPRGVAGRR